MSDHFFGLVWETRPVLFRCGDVSELSPQSETYSKSSITGFCSLVPKGLGRGFRQYLKTVKKERHSFIDPHLGITYWVNNAFQCFVSYLVCQLFGQVIDNDFAVHQTTVF